MNILLFIKATLWFFAPIGALCALLGLTEHNEKKAKA